MKNEQNQEMLYMCGKCGHEIDKNAKVCPHCGARLGKIQCPYCKFTGDEEDFKKDICPKCGHHKTLSLPYGDKVSNIPQMTKQKKEKNKLSSNKKSHTKNYELYKTICIIMGFITFISIISFIIYFKLI